MAAWIVSENVYIEKVARVENQIITKLRDRLASVKNSNQMFRVFSKFNALFVRPKIRGAIQEYQTQLIGIVKDDIRSLQDKFKVQYRDSEACALSAARDIPPVAGAIMWARMIERQLMLFMKRVEDVLGQGWELYSDGQKLKAESTNFLRMLDTKPVFDAWLADITRRPLSIDGPIFVITRSRAKGNVAELEVNFDRQIVMLFKEVRSLTWLQFQIPHAVATVGKDARRVYPVAVSLTETLRIYQRACVQVEELGDMSVLMNGFRNQVQSVLSRGKYSHSFQD